MSMSDFWTAVEHGAAAVYHAVLATGAEIIDLASNPAVAPLLSQGAMIANAVLTRCGIPGAVLTILEADIAIAIKLLAAKDATVHTVQTTPLANPTDAIADQLNAVELHAIESHA